MILLSKYISEKETKFEPLSLRTQIHFNVQTEI